MIAYLVYNADYRLYEIHEEKPVYRYGVGWYSEGYYEGVSQKNIPEEVKEALAEKGMLEVLTTPVVLLHMRHQGIMECEVEGEGE